MHFLICLLLFLAGPTCQNEKNEKCEIIESKIDDTFEGHDNENIYKLANGQAWEQTNFHICTRYKYRPEVLITCKDKVCKMFTEGCDILITVRRLR
jgi:hypothetical protein